MRSLCTLLVLLSLVGACLPAAALRDTDLTSVRAALAYGQAHFDAVAGLVTDATGAPNVPESSAGYVAACFATGEDLDRARLVLGRILDVQIQSGKDKGCLPWRVVPEAAPGVDAVLYATPLLAYLARYHREKLGPELTARLKQGLTLALNALERVSADPPDEARYLLRTAARATAQAALGGNAGGAAGEVGRWLKMVHAAGLPAGHSPTLDAVKYVSLKWVRESVPENGREVVDQALLLTALDLAGRVHPPAGYLAGALTQAFSDDYTAAAGFASYVLSTDFGLPPGERVEPYVMAAVLPQWRAPESVAALTLSSGMRRTRASGSPVVATDTYVGQFASLGTMCGQVGPATVPIFATFARSARPTMYFYCLPTPVTIQTVQADNLAVCSFNFDGIGTTQSPQASLRGVLGTSDTVHEVMCFGVPWNGKPTAVGEAESVAIATEECYVGITLMRTGAATNQQGAMAKPGVLEWSDPAGKGNLLLTIYARQQSYPVPTPLYDMRAGVVIEVASQLAYPSLAAFVKHVAAGRIKQSVHRGKERQPEKEQPAREPGAIVPQPRSRIERVYRAFIQQTTEYTGEGRTLKLVEDLLNNTLISREVDGQAQADTALWESEFFTLESKGDLGKALEAYGK